MKNKINKQTTKQNIKTVVLVSLFWLILAGVVFTIVLAYKNGVISGTYTGLQKCKEILNK